MMLAVLCAKITKKEREWAGFCWQLDGGVVDDKNYAVCFCYIEKVIYLCSPNFLIKTNKEKQPLIVKNYDRSSCKRRRKH
jgi:hypothetical protein